MVHECGNHCKFEKSVILNTVEREQVADTNLVFLHELLYVYCVLCVLCFITTVAMHFVT